MLTQTSTEMVQGYCHMFLFVGVHADRNVTRLQPFTTDHLRHLAREISWRVMAR